MTHLNNPENPHPDFIEAMRKHPLVHTAWRQGTPLETLILQLVNERQSLFERILELEAIAPRKITHDGKTGSGIF